MSSKPNSDSTISRYYSQPVNIIDDNYFYLEDDFVLNDDQSDLVTYVREEEVHRLDLLAYRVYQNPLYAWVIARKNMLENMEDLWLGREIRYPPKESIFKNGGIVYH